MSVFISLYQALIPYQSNHITEVSQAGEVNCNRKRLN